MFVKLRLHLVLMMLSGVGQYQPGCTYKLLRVRLKKKLFYLSLKSDCDLSKIFCVIYVIVSPLKMMKMPVISF